MTNMGNNYASEGWLGIVSKNELEDFINFPIYKRCYTIFYIEGRKVNL